MANKKFLNKVFDTIYDCKVAIKFTNRRGAVLDFPASEVRMFYWLHNMKKTRNGGHYRRMRCNYTRRHGARDRPRGALHVGRTLGWPREFPPGVQGITEEPEKCEILPTV